MRIRSFTSESVAEGHPDKIADQISDAIVDAALTADRQARVAVETLVTKDTIILAGEVTCARELDYAGLARQVVRDLDYTDPIYEFTDRSPVTLHIQRQSPDIARGVDDGGAGDQGMMFGYACRETPEYMPAPIMLAHRLVEAMDQARKTGVLPYLRPDGKSQVRLRYDDGTPTAVEGVVLAVPHQPSLSKGRLAADLYETVVRPVVLRYGLDVTPDELRVNGTGRWEIGGPASDTGVTGRKVMVDTYGGMARHGGGCFSGKDPTKVDRSGAYACRYVAKSVVAAGLADRCEVRVAYVIGQREPMDKQIETFGTEKVGRQEVEDFAWGALDLSVPGILEGLELRRPLYRATARYGHFGRAGFPWEEVSA